MKVNREQRNNYTRARVYGSYGLFGAFIRAGPKVDPGPTDFGALVSARPQRADPDPLSSLEATEGKKVPNFYVL